MSQFIKKHKLLVIMFLAFMLICTACSQKTNKPPSKDEQTNVSKENIDDDVTEDTSEEDSLVRVYPANIQIVNAESVLKPGKYKLEVAVSPKNAVKGYRTTLQGSCDFAQIEDNTLVIGQNAPDNARLTIKVTSKYDMLISSTRTFVVSNAIDWIDISTEEQLLKINKNLSGNYRLVNDIYLTKEWEGIGTPDTTVEGKTVEGKGFSGRFNGNGFTIHNLDMTSDGGYNKAFFYQTEENAVIEQLSLEGSVYGSSWCAALVGINKGLVKNCVTSVEVKTVAAPCAAFVGTNKGTIVNCLAIGSATAGPSSAGHGAGFVNVNNGTIQSSYALATSIEFAEGYKKQANTDITKSEEFLKTKASFSDWDNTIWNIVNGKYPYLRTELNIIMAGETDDEDNQTGDQPDAEIVWIDIANEEDLIGISDDLNANYRLTNNIELTQDWAGIGTAASGSDAGVSFNGRFNGNGYTISGFNMVDANGFNLGFFKQTGVDAIIENVRLIGAVSGRNYCSALVGINNGIVRNCVTDVTVTGKSAPSSGFVGTNNGQIINCYALGEVTVVENDNHGSGFVNANHATKGVIASSFGLNTSMKYAVGYNKVTNEAILKSDAQLKTAATFADWDTDIWYISNKMYPVLKYPNFTENDILPQSVILEGCSDTMSPGVYNLEASVLPACASQDVIFSLIGEKEGVSLEGNVLTIESNVEDGISIVIKAMSDYDSMIYTTHEVFISSIDWTDISTEAELKLISNDLDGNYRLVCNINLTEVWAGIGRPASGSDKGESFNGRFNGNGYSITGFRMEDSNGYNMGFFMQTGENAIIEKLRLEGTVSGRNYCSALVGINHGTVKNCITDVAVTGKSAPSSGFVGTNNGTIAYCMAIGQVTVVGNGNHGAGFVNSNHATKGVITSSYALDSSMPYAVGYNKVSNTAITKTDSALKTASTYTGWDQNIWYISNGAYPIFKRELQVRTAQNQCANLIPTVITNGFVEDFSGGICSDNWYISEKRWGSLENYQGTLTKNVSYTKNGVLVLKAQGSQSEDVPLSGAALVSTQEYGAGSYSICMKPASVLGVCNAIWTFYYEANGTINHEIDIEFPGHITDGAEGTVGSDIGYHRMLTTNWTSLTNKTSVGTELETPANDGNWHVYRFDWHTEPEPYIEFYMDGKLISTSTTNVPTKKGLLWFGIWLPKEWCGTPDFDTDCMLVDWVSYQPFDEYTEETNGDPGNVGGISAYPSKASEIQ